ncbi:MAG: NUDIX hydrolase [Luteolibacter sp.]
MRDLLQFSRELAAIGQAGITYSTDAYDRERFARLREMAGELLEISADVPSFTWPPEVGYDTPKVDVRAVVFRGDAVLLVKETRSGLWTVPGGWADVNFSPAQNAEKECWEESGYSVKAKSLVSVIDRDHAGYPRNANSIYKMFFLCEITGGEAASSIESSEVGFFPLDELPALDPDRIREVDIRHAYAHQTGDAAEVGFN